MQFGRIDMNNDFPIVRLGWVIMNRAEAAARLGGGWNVSAAVLSDVNQIRNRANANPYASAAELTESEFLAERGREFFGEALRRTDLIRFDAYKNTWWEKTQVTPAYKNIMPIPFTAIQAANGTLVQNPGY